jgi:hypothetical protein
MAKLPHKPLLTFRAHVAGDWHFKDPTMAGAELSPELIGGVDDPKEFIVYYGEQQVAVLDFLLDKKMNLIIAMEEGGIAGEFKYVFDQIILYQEAFAFAESILSNVDRILLDITAANLPVFKILEELGLLVLPTGNPIGKEAIYNPRNRMGGLV